MEVMWVKALHSHNKDVIQGSIQPLGQARSMMRHNSMEVLPALLQKKKNLIENVQLVIYHFGLIGARK